MRTKRIYKARLVYFFICEKCGTSNRQTYKRSRLKTKVCRKCARLMPNPNQVALFPPENIDTTQTVSDNVPEV